MSIDKVPGARLSREQLGEIVATLKSELNVYQEADSAALRDGHADILRIKNALKDLHEEDLSAQDEDEKFRLMTIADELMAKIDGLDGHPQP